MTRIAALLTAAVLVLAPVQASNAAPLGGPTSVMLASPNFERTASLYHSDVLYERLQRFVEANEASGEAGNDGWREPHPHGSGPLVRATWLTHDMFVWRIDRIFPRAPGGPWIATSLHDSTKPMDDGKAVWHKTSDPRGLLQVLAQLRLLDSGPLATVPAPIPEEPPAAAADTAAAADAASTGWRWSFAGLVVGVLVTVLALRVVRRRDTSQRWELIG